MRTYEQKKELVKKWFSEEELRTLENQLNSVEVKHIMPQLENQSPVSMANIALVEIADEKERIYETVVNLSDCIDNHTIGLLVEGMEEIVNKRMQIDICGISEEVILHKEEINDISNVLYGYTTLIKVVTQIIESGKRIERLDESIERYKQGVITL